MLKMNDFVRILTVKDDNSPDAEGRVNSNRKEDGTYWVVNLNMPFMGTTSEYIHESDLMEIKEWRKI